ncbi:glutamate racemase [Streptomyces lonarensis]|uniref:Glutamate racemase n=1 Tax=Streptomyces lonarensis TaxID=700599 RepID=A0A7X6I009_9ACTN|nr:aspartate/glutamate racemase family protein [Streptomyces lonarensis]NJQ07151.1 glutamate racemase [Streptomyces lonarensis]
MRIALIDSGLGQLPAAAALRRLRPDASLVLSADPEGMPWGPRTPEDITRRALACARAAARTGPDALVVACNTASVHALEALRAELEPGVPVVGTVPAVKPAAAGGGPVAVWATPATTGSGYQRRLIDRFAAGVDTTEVPCHGLADAVEQADPGAVARAVKAAAALTPTDVTDVVLGCTHYELVGERIREELAVQGGAPAVRLHGSASAVAHQVLRRLGVDPAPEAEPGPDPVFLASGHPAPPPAALLGYREGRGLVRPDPVA